MYQFPHANLESTHPVNEDEYYSVGTQLLVLYPYGQTVMDWQLSGDARENVSLPHESDIAPGFLLNRWMISPT